MFCKKCGEKTPESQKFCSNCGTLFSNTPNDGTKKSLNIGIAIVVVLAIIGFIIYGSVNQDSVEKNNEALTSFNSGDSQGAVSQLQQAVKDVNTDDAKIMVLRNLAYVYESEGEYDQAYNTYIEALAYAREDTFDYYITSAEIARLEGKQNAAEISYNKAYQLKPNDFQINNSLALFYLDLDGLSTNYIDYPKALIHAQKAYDNDTEESEAGKQNLAIAHLFNGDYDKAILLFLSTNLNQHPYVAYWLGVAYMAKGDDVNAKFYFQKAVDAGIEVEQEVHDYLN